MEKLGGRFMEKTLNGESEDCFALRRRVSEDAIVNFYKLFVLNA